MTQDYRPFEYRILDEFPEARRIRVWEGGSCHIATHCGHFHAILDSRTVVDFEDAEELGELVKIKQP